MSDHEFEKQVQQKLDGLKLRPSDTIWKEVEKNIQTHKRRRRFFWLWFPVLCVCLSTSGYVLYRYFNVPQQKSGITQSVPTSESHALTSETTAAHTPVTPNNNTSNTTPSEPVITVQPLTTNTPEQVVQQKEVTTKQQKPVDASVENVIEKKKVTGISSNEIVSAAIPATSSAPKNGLVTNNRTVEKKHTTLPGKKNGSNSALPRSNRLAVVKRDIDNSKVENEKMIAYLSEPEANRQMETEPVHNAVAAMPAIMKEDHSIATGKAVSDSLNNKVFRLVMPDSLGSGSAITMEPIRRKRPPLWHWGIEVNGGLSDISTSNLFQLKELLEGQNKSTTEAAFDFNSPQVNNNSLLTVAAPVVRKASPVQRDLSYSAGVFVQRTLSNRLKVSVGAGYNYMSVYTHVGEKVMKEVLVNIGPSTVKKVPEYYRGAGTPKTADSASSPSGYGLNGLNQRNDTNMMLVSDRYRYRFHFIEVPVLVKWQINKGRKLPPIVLDGGFSISHLISVDALHYEGKKGIYYKENSLFNKTQFNVITGLSVGIMQRTKHPVWIGPHLRYAVSSLVKKEMPTAQYLWSAGFNVKMLLGRL